MAYPLLAGVVAILAVVALVLNATGSLEGAAFFGEKTSPYEFNEFCVDDDPGNEFHKAGIVKYGVYSYIDHCDEDQLHQHYCATSQNVKHAKHYTCPNGCANGVCRR